MDKIEGKGCEFDVLNLEIQSEENNKKIIDILKLIISDGINYDKDISNSINSLLTNKDPEVKCLTAQVIAELCKCEKKRIIYGQSNTVNKLLEFLDEPLDFNNTELMKQSCRALGNICFDSYVGRDLVLNAKGIPIIVELLPRTLKSDEGDIKTSYSNVRLYACKLLLILMLGGSEYIQPALDADFIKKDHAVIKYEFSSECGNDDRLHTSLLIMSVVTEYNRSLIMEESLTLLIVDILKTIKNCEISEVCLEYLHHQAEHDEVKTVLAKAAVPQILWSLLEKYRSLAVDEETRELKKLACDLIALVLTGDDSMDHLYASGKGEFYLKMIDSLNSEDVELSITAILAVGNFARTDKHCMNMMDTGVFSKLMSILLLHKNHEDDIRLQHVVLSGLRNLVIPQRNKPLAIEHGILPLLIEMVPNVTQYHVVFKLLATLRMLVDGQEAVAENLVSSNILDRVSKWGTQNEHAGVSGEASRLLARTVRQLQSRESFIKMIKIKDCITCLVNMMTATHAIMQNEAIISLSMICITCLFDQSSSQDSNNTKDALENNTNDSDEIKNILVQQLIESNLADRLFTLIEKNTMHMQKEIAENIIKFILMITNQELLREQLCEIGISANLKKLKLENSNLDNAVKDSIENLILEIGDKMVETTM